MLGPIVFSRRRVAYLMGGAAAAMFAPLLPLRALPGRTVTAYKDASCSCCGGWMRHMVQAGFDVSATNVTDLAAIKTKFGIPDSLATCHTAEIDGYLIEGHVPAVVIERLLRERPKGRGLAVPGMPAGSPGMESPQHETYEVFLFTDSGQSVFARCRGTVEI